MNIVSNNNFIMKNFCEMFDNEVLSDIKLILNDGRNQLSLNLHRVILHTQCQYFEKMFSNFQQKFENNMDVVDIHAAKDIIKLFYGFKSDYPTGDWQYDLKYYICCDYFGINCSLPINIKVSSECFNVLLDLIDIMGYTDETVKILADNLPYDYDVSSLPVKLLREINNKIPSNDMVIMSSEHRRDPKIQIDIVNKDLGKLKNIYNKKNCDNLCYLSKINKIVFTRKNKLMVYDLESERIEKRVWSEYIAFRSLIYNSIKNEIIALLFDYKETRSLVYILSTETFNNIETICCKKPGHVIRKICLSLSCDKLSYVLEKGVANIWTGEDNIIVYDFNTKKHTCVYSSSDDRIYGLKFIKNDTSIMFFSKHTSNIKYEIKIYNIEGSGEIVHT
ncbi:putative BTB/POZ domain-containing protein [Cotonvirus japonicus]|uniref:BTB/POZ domain-containing protein n=1 Tax=Cotonvirus japonicus TaxID=2811091 RepID=A0ABM7NQT2_9VIRU|nr:putative BTB/POZ domain-containing protein [Cotonvirus japonicus]BCS82494.1 putative BTB/POZ domain-containing protein [Cotonvirus japonicus]